MTNLDDERISKFQRQIYDWLRELYPSFSMELEKHIPKTNQRIDIYIENLTLAVECDGIQHFKPVGFYVKTIEQWDKMIESDKIKNKVLEEAGITVLRIPYNHKLKSAEDLKTLINSLKSCIDCFSLLSTSSIYLLLPHKIISNITNPNSIAACIR